MDAASLSMSSAAAQCLTGSQQGSVVAWAANRASRNKKSGLILSVALWVVVVDLALPAAAAAVVVASVVDVAGFEVVAVAARAVDSATAEAASVIVAATASVGLAIIATAIEMDSMMHLDLYRTAHRVLHVLTKIARQSVCATRLDLLVLIFFFPFRCFMHLLFVSVELFSNYLIRNFALNAKTSNMSV